jgi:hypothetical protein
MMPNFLDHPYVRQLRRLNLPLGHYTIAGSAPLAARHWITEIGDLDVVAQGPAWQIANKLGRAEPAQYAEAERITLFDGHIEILSDWFPEFGSVSEIIRGSDMIHGLPFMSLHVVAATKKKLGRPRDLTHLQIMRDNGFPC